MYPRSKFQEVLLEIRQEMAREADFDVDLFAEIVRSGSGPRDANIHSLVDQGSAGTKSSRRSQTPFRTSD